MELSQRKAMILCVEKEKNLEVNFLYVTTETLQEAQLISRAAVKQGLAACANILGEIDSIYLWDGELRENKETAFFLKTSNRRLNKLIDLIKKLHSYECPCILVNNIVGGNKNFLNWIDQQTKF